MPPLPRTARKTTRALLALAVLAAASMGQDGQLTKDDLERGRQRIEEHARRPVDGDHDPLRLSGREQGDNDLRSRTPALTRTVPGAERIAPEAAHRRALALYEEGARFHVATSSRPANARPRTGPRTAGEKAEAPESAYQTMARPWWQVALPGFLVGFLVVAFLYRRLHRTGPLSA